MTLLVLDGNSILNRAFYGIRPLTTKDGQYTNAIHGFMSMLLKIEAETSPDAVAIAFDVRAKTFRHKAYDGYKAKRKGMPEELAQQMEPLKDLLRALGYTLVTCEGYEADDILGTLARTCREKGENCVIATGDRDTLQLVGEGVSVHLLHTKGGKPEALHCDEEYIRENYHVAPIELIDVKAIQGDTSDNIPGVPGIGEKGAQELISRFHSLDYIYENLDTLDIKEGMRKKLREGRESAYLSRMLGTVCTEAPIDCNLESYLVAPADVERATALLIKLEMFKMIERLKLGSRGGARQKTIHEKSPAGDFTVIPPSDTEQEQAEEENNGADIELLAGYSIEVYTQMQTAGGICIACEYAENMPQRAAVCWKINDEKTVHVFEGAALSAFMREVLPDKGISKVVHDYKALCKYAARAGIRVRGVRFDIMLAAYLHNPLASDYTLERLCAQYGQPIDEGTPAPLRLAVACAQIPDIALKMQLSHLSTDEISLHNNIELPLAKVLAEMEEEGFEADREGIEAFGTQLSERIEQLKTAIYESVGYQFNLNSPKQIGEAFFVKLGLQGGKKTKTGYSTNAETLEKLRGEHEAVDMLLEYRTLSKLHSTYCVGLLRAICKDGRIRSSFNQTETRTGRISSAEPNMQNIPVRTPLGAQMRKFLRAREGCVLVDADYSQIELRVLAHCANDHRMIAAFLSGDDIHTITAAQVFNVPVDEVTPRMRSDAKAVNFGIVYGISAFSLGKDIGVSSAAASAYIKSYLATYSGVDAYMKELIEKAKEEGCAKTLFGRRRQLPELASSNFQTRSFGERVARNMPIQGTAADIIKIAMVNVAHALQEERIDARLILQVHDELILEASNADASRAAALLEREMRNAAQMSVPLVVDVHIGKTWYDAKG